MGLTHTVSGDVAHFRTPSRVPIDSLKFHFLPKQASGTPTPANPIPIEGWTGLNGWRANNNLFALSDFSYMSNSKVEYTIDKTNSIKIVCKQQGNAWDNSSQEVSIDIPEALRGKAVYFGIGEVILETVNKQYQRSTIVCEFRDESNTFITDPTVVSVKQTEDPQNPNTYARKFTIPSNAAKLKIYFRIAQNISTYGVYVGDYIIYKNFYIRASTETYGYVKHEGGKIPMVFPVAGTNKTDPNTIILEANLSLSDGVYSNTAVDARDYSQLQIQLWKTTGTYIKSLTTINVNTTGTKSLTFEVDDPDCHYIAFKHNGAKKDFRILIPFNLGLGIYTLSINLLSADPTVIGGFRFKDVQLEVGGTAHAFEPYSSDNTFYGGYIDPVAGEIVAEYEILEGLWGDWPNLSDLGDGTELRYKKFANPVYGNGITNHYTDYCNVAKYVYSNENGNPHYYIVGSSYNCRVYLPSGYDTTQNVQVIGKLITPIRIPISSQSLKAFLDHNNFWSDANDITEVSYEVMESKDIQVARNRFEAEEDGHHKLVRWNQWAKEVSSSYWRAYNTTYASLTFNDGVGTRTTLSDVSQSYTDAVRSINECAFNKDHKYYIQQDLKASKTKNYVTIIGSGWKGQHLVNADTWTTIKSINTPNVADDEKNMPIWACYSGNTYSLAGETCQFKNVMFIDLTQMFGLGNEPSTVAEFERICEINGIDLTTYQPYDEGSDRWLIVP